MLRAHLIVPLDHGRRPRAWLAAVTLAGLAACSPPDADLAGPVEPLGAFRLGYNIVVADNAREVEPSRSASSEEWEEAFTRAIDQRFSRFDGTQLYHIAILVDGFSIAVTGVPGVVTPQSVVAIGVTIWDDAAGGKINDEPEVFAVFERVGGDSAILGSGATLTREEQIENLAKNAARQIELWMRKNPDWFEPRAGAATSVRIVNNEVVRPTETSEPVLLTE